MSSADGTIPGLVEDGVSEQPIGLWASLLAVSGCSGVRSGAYPYRQQDRGVYRQDIPTYPLEAVREALVNALCHRDYANFGGAIDLAMYDDRMEITSPGGLHFGLTVEDLRQGHTSRLWNPTIAEVVYKRGIIDRWGAGRFGWRN